MAKAFYKLFGDRSRNTKGEKTRIQIMLNIDVTSKGIMIQKTYGPFVIDIPAVNKGDMYKFIVYSAMKNNFTLLWAEHISAIGARVIAYDKQFFLMGKFNG